MSDLFGQTQPIKALSIWQPWASLMAAGIKRHETRHWATSYRGPIAIHAAKTLDTAGAPEQLCRDAFGPFWMRTLPLGMVVAVGDLTACDPAERIAGHLQPADLEAGNFAKGRFAWRIENIRALEQPFPLIGRQGLFNWTPPEDLETRLRSPIDHAAACRYIGWGSTPLKRAG